MRSRRQLLLAATLLGSVALAGATLAQQGQQQGGQAQAQGQGQQQQQQSRQGQPEPRHRFAGGQEPAVEPVGERRPGATFERVVDPAAIEVPPGYRVEVFATGLNYPTDITFGPDGEAYVSEAGGHFYGTDPAQAPPPRILRIRPDGTKDVIFDDAVPYQAIRGAGSYRDIPQGLIGPVEGVTYNPRNGLLYIAHRTRYSTLDPRTGRFRTIIDGLPAWGIFHNTKVVFDPQGRMIFGVSSQGNSGAVDSAMLKVLSFYNLRGRREVPCEDVTLTGRDVTVENPFTPEEGDAELTGVFVPYGHRTRPGQTVPGEFWCNSALYRANADGTNPERLAWGIRNAFHYAFSPADGGLYFSNNSGNPIPGRPVYNDWETVYRLEPAAWYGWPDYYSSVPITDQRFARPNDPQFKGEPFPHEFALTEETRARLLRGRPTPPPPVVRIESHAGAQGFVFPGRAFGMPSQEILLAEFGAVVPYEVARGRDAPGFQVSRLDLRSGQRTAFMRNKSGQPASAAPGQPAPRGGGLERPVRLEMGPDGALYVVDFGVFDVSPRPQGEPTKMAFGNTGVIWRVVRSEGQQPPRQGGQRPAGQGQQQQ